VYLGDDTKLTTMIEVHGHCCCVFLMFSFKGAIGAHKASLPQDVFEDARNRIFFRFRNLRRHLATKIRSSLLGLGNAQGFSEEQKSGLSALFGGSISMFNLVSPSHR
jgi:hypothetical protein